MNLSTYNLELLENGYSIIPDIYSDKEIVQLINCIDSNQKIDEFHSKSKEIFAIRQLLNSIPELKNIIFNKSLIALLSNVFEENFFLTKAIYFDKPKESNWFVAHHQDLSISVNEKVEIEGYKNWTFKKGQHGVQPPIEILENTITIRIHLDDTEKNNGALKVITSSHLNGVVRTDSETVNREDEKYCEVKQGGVMLMKPLLFHASNRSENNKRRRVIHLEFNSIPLHSKLNWLEYLQINAQEQNWNQSV